MTTAKDVRPMPGFRRLAAALVVGLVPLLSGAPASTEPVALKPFKDTLFSLPATLSTGEGGAMRVVDYREMRDINGRDEVPERRVRGEYVSLGVRRQQRELSLGGLRHFAVGRAEGARMVTVYLHGQGGNRRQGVDDFTFGGNFNRIKNLMAENGGLYLSPDVPDFGERGARAIATLVEHYANRSPGAPVILACGSMGGAICHALARNGDIAPRLGGILLVGSHWDPGFVGSAAFKRRVPLYIGQGSRDTVFPAEKQETFLRAILTARSDYPVRYVRFESGTHGTPIRMTDWRETLNWMLAAR